MATYAIGDIQGCFQTLKRLLQRIGFDPRWDRLWLTGDLVNRGPDSLAVLRWACGLGDRVVAVLGNHDVHLLAVACGVRPMGPDDTLQAVWDAPDRDALLAWLQARPLMHQEGLHVLVHAGLVPSWSIPQALALAREVEEVLQGPRASSLLACLSEPVATAWQADLTGEKRWALVTHVLTYLRVCNAQGDMLLSFSGPPQAAPEGYMPWFDVPGRQSRSHTVVCGHWSALGLHKGEQVCALDTGCVWGRHLTAYRLEDGAVYQEPAVCQGG